MTGAVAARSVADVDGFITMLRAACEDREVNERLQQLLSLPDERRRALLHTWITDLIVAGAPADFVQALGCLMDDRVAEKAYEVIFHCEREARTGRGRWWLAWTAAAVALALIALIAFLAFRSPAPARFDRKSVATPATAYAQEIRRKIQGLTGGHEANAAGGSATVLLYIDASGELDEVKLLRSSGDEKHDDRSLLLVMSAGPFSAPPPDLQAVLRRNEAHYLALEMKVEPGR